MATKTDSAHKTFTKSCPYSTNRPKSTAIPVWCRPPKLQTLANAYNLNIPRYIDNSEPEDLHDLDAHLNGGIPGTDIDALDDYWEVFPKLRNKLFKANGRPGYSDPQVETQHVKTTILSHNEFTNYQQRVTAIYDTWQKAHAPRLGEIDTNTLPRDNH